MRVRLCRKENDFNFLIITFLKEIFGFNFFLNKQIFKKIKEFW